MPDARCQMPDFLCHTPCDECSACHSHVPGTMLFMPYTMQPIQCLSYSDAKCRTFVCRRSRYSLALTGVTIVVASLATTIGLLSLAGVGTTLIVWEVRFHDVAPKRPPLHRAEVVPAASSCDTCSTVPCRSRFNFLLSEDNFEIGSCSDG